MKRSKRLTSESVLKTAYVLGGLIVCAALLFLLYSLIRGFGDKGGRNLPSGPDYAVPQLSVWDGEELPDADAFLTASSRGMVSTARYLMRPDTTVGDQNVAILMQLDDGTTRTENAVLSILEPVIRWELGTPATAQSLLGTGYKNVKLAEPLESFTEVGSYPVTVTIDGKPLAFTLIVQDTTPPEVTLNTDLNFYINQKIGLSDFIASAEDVSAIEYHFSDSPTTSEEGEFCVQVIATDAAGNSQTYDAWYTVSGDGQPPVISGAKTMHTICAIPIDYMRGVEANDAKDGKVAVTAAEPADFSIRTPGEYTITYTAKDAAGNVAEEQVKLIVHESLDSLDELSKEDIYRIGDYIVNSLRDGTENKDKRAFLRKIYLYVQNHMFYEDNKVILDWEEAAVVAISRGYGDCRNYYSFARLLLTCAGFENMMVEHEKQNEWSNAHYWNLVKVDGAWYHFDTTPRVKRSDFFLLTDAELDAYSRMDGNCFARDTSLYPATPS